MSSGNEKLFNKYYTPIKPEIEKSIMEIIKERNMTFKEEKFVDDFENKFVNVMIYDCNGAELFKYSRTTSKILMCRFNLWCEWNEANYPTYLNTIMGKDTISKDWIAGFLLPPTEKCKGSMELWDKKKLCGKQGYCEKTIPKDKSRPWILPHCSNRSIDLCGGEKCKRYELCLKLKILRTVPLTADQIAMGER